MAEQEFTTAEEFMECVKNCEFDFDFLPESYIEGYLYPDTYPNTTQGKHLTDMIDHV